MDPFVAKEWSAPATDSADIGWDRRPRPLPPLPDWATATVSQHRRPRVPASLADQAARVAAANIQDIDPSHLQDLSPRSLQLLLKYLDLKTISLSTWKALQQLGRAGHIDTNKELTLHHRHFFHHIKEPTADLPVYLAPLQSQDFTFISHLRLAGSCLIKAEELLYLPQWSKNLGLLELLEPSDPNTPFPRLSDRLFRAWSLHDDPFPKLKGIIISTHSSITAQSLRYLTQFPALIMLDITAGKRDWTHANSKSLAEGLGWIHCNCAEAQSWNIHDDDEGDPGVEAEIDVKSHKDWMRLSTRLDLPDIATSTIPSTWESTLSTMFRCFKIHNFLQMPASKMLQLQEDLRRRTPSSSALASLILGQDQKLILRHRPAFPQARMFFWRYWEDGVRYPIPAEKGQGATQKTSPSTERSEKPASAIIRSRKKRPASSISDVLSQFEGR